MQLQILVIVSCISATAVVGLLLAIAVSMDAPFIYFVWLDQAPYAQVSAFNTRKSKSRNLFVRSHVAGYFISLLLCEITQSAFIIKSLLAVSCFGAVQILFAQPSDLS